MKRRRETGLQNPEFDMHAGITTLLHEHLEETQLSLSLKLQSPVTP